jgi:LPXTG-site transpeptidase (sortase) family protein
VAAWQLNATLWTIHSERVGHALIQQFLKNKALAAPLKSPTVPAGTTSLAACSAAAAGGGSSVQGLLVIPKLGLTAPVLEGTEESSLDVGVGHNPNSVWPGTPGNSVLAAHDVSYFQNISALEPGDTIRYESPCLTYTFHVQSHTIVKQGAPVYETSGPTLTMVTCWPTNALWFTPDRYVVSATEVSTRLTNAANRTYLAAAPGPAVNIPAALAAQGVTLETYSLPMGTMQVTGDPDPAWANTTGPLRAQTSGVDAYIAGVRALTENQLGWWQDIAPYVTPPPALLGAEDPHYESPLNVTVAASGDTATGLTLTNTVLIKGGSAPGAYTMTVTEAVRRGILVVTDWTLTPLA